MTSRTFAPWVEPIAAELRFTRGEIANAAHLMLPDIWGWLSPLPGWTYKDLLGHCATGDWVCQTVLRTVIDREALDLSKINSMDPDFVAEGNARLIEERKTRTPEELIAELEAEAKETQELLSKLTDEDENRTQDGVPMSLGEYLRAFHNHDLTHLAQLKTATDNVML